MREKILNNWVKQAAAPPNIQYLRDAERYSAWDQLGSQGRVLDIASESNVTAGLDADHVTRLDFAPQAIEYAAELLGDDVDEYESTDPEHPELPFPDDHFDAAVSIGPYDWKFLDVDALTREVHRVLKPDARFVFSVPTPRSPYWNRGRNKYRYFEPEEALSHISPDFRLGDVDLVFQYPYYPHRAINLLDDEYQEYFVDAAWWATDKLTEYGLWDRAAYLVLGAEKLDYDSFLDGGLDALFRSTDENGFWDDEEGKFVRALDYELGDDGPTWSVDDSIQWRYAPFALLGSMQWRSSPLASDEYDEQLRQELEYFTARVGEDDTLAEMPSYGIGPLTASFALAAETFDDPNYGRTARHLFDHAVDRFDFTDAEDSLLAYGWSYLYEYEPTDDVRSALEDALWSMNERLTMQHTFRFENVTTRRHQNQMYTVWGLARAIEVLEMPGYLDTLEEVLDFAVDERMREDGAFIWEDVSWRRRRKGDVLAKVGFRPAHWKFLYECHQTFFVNAVSHYYDAGGRKDYDRDVARAMAWIYGENDLGTNLVDESGLGVPMRFLTTSGRMDVDDQMFKGAYEVGSYVMALTNLLSEPFRPEGRTDPQTSRRKTMVQR